MQVALVVENLSKTLSDRLVLDDISFRADPGEVLALLGPSGSGKSTLLRCLNLLTIPDSGTIRINGDHIECKQKKGKTVIGSPAKVQKMRTMCGMVFQHFNLWAHMSALENLIEAPIHVLKQDRDEVIERAHQLLKKVKLSDKANCYPAELSGGQQQRIGIARALMMQPKVLLFDEPTSALDPEMVGSVLKVMRDIASEGTTMVVATHEMSFARDVASKIIFLENGKIALSGEPEALFTDKTQQRFQQFIRCNNEETT